MASITQVPAGWRARYRTPEGESRSRTFRLRQQAKDFLTGIEAEKLSGDFIDPAAQRKVTFKKYADDWLKIQPHRAQTLAGIERSLRIHIYPVLGHRPIASIRPSEVQGLITDLGLTQAPGHVKIIRQHLGQIFNAAVADKVIHDSPAARVKLPQAEKVLVVPPTPEMVLALADAVPGRYRALVVLGAGSGLRIGELLGLEVSSIDFLRRTVTVKRQLLPSGKFGPPKSVASSRTVPLPTSVVEAVSAHLAEFGTGPDGLVFTSTRGTYVPRTAVRDHISNKVGEMTPHDLRHFYASALIRFGESVTTVQARLGHGSAMTTLDTYGHLWPDADDRTREAVEAAFKLDESPRVTIVSSDPS